MLEKKITFDSFIRGALIVVIIVAVIMLVNRLSSVLLPFFIAWLLAYMLYPLVRFLQYKCRLRSRVVSIVVALVAVLGALTGILYLIIPPMVSEVTKLSDLVVPAANEFVGQSGIADSVDQFIKQFVNENNIVKLVQQKNVMDALQTALGQAWDLIYQTMGFLAGIFTVFVVFLYMFFILLDYEKISNGWPRLIPTEKRPFFTGLVEDVERGMNAYFRGQSLIALIVGILFSIGFLLIDFPLAVGLGLFIGFLNLVPYLQLIGFIPTILLALMKSIETGQNFWVILLMALAVFAVVQAIQDMYLTPRIMGHVTGLNPAVILLSLSVWGSLLGFIGLIVALPLTTLCLSYYRRFVVKE